MAALRPDRVTVEHAAAIAGAATVGGWLQDRVAGWPWEGAALTAALLCYVAYRDQRRRHLRYPPRSDPPTEAAASLAVDGSPCRGWPSLAVASRLVEKIESQLDEAAGQEREERLWRR